MSREALYEVYRQHRVTEDKYTYFLLAAAGAAIALAVNQTSNSSIALSQIPLAGALLFWALSFFFGCRHLAYISSILFANFSLLRVEMGEDPRVGQQPQLQEAAAAGIHQAIHANLKRAQRNVRRQFACLIFGAVMYLAWHVTEMVLRSKLPPK